MDPATIATIASAGSKILSSFGFGGSKKDKTPSIEEQLQAQRASQRELDVERPSWIRQGAEKAGLHPLAVMGISPASGGNFYLDGGQEKKGVDFNALGQGIDRLANVSRTQRQKELDDLAVEQAKLSNDYLRVQIAGAQKAIATTGQTVSYGSGAGDYLLPGQSGSGVQRVAPEPSAPTIGANKSQPHREGGAYPEIGYKQTSPTELRIVASKNQKERMEDDPFETVKFHARHSVPLVSDFRRNFTKGGRPPYPSEVPLPQGYKRWVWSYDRWRAAKK